MAKTKPCVCCVFFRPLQEILFFYSCPSDFHSSPPLCPRLKLWIVKLTQQPPMYTASLARMFVGVMPVGILMHMALTVYMLGNANILDIGFIR